MEKLREEMARVIETENAYGYYAHHRALELAESILSIPALRTVLEKATGTCEWVHETEWYPHVYHTSCGKIESEEFVNQRPFCPFCGKRIEVKDVEKG